MFLEQKVHFLVTSSDKYHTPTKALLAMHPPLKTFCTVPIAALKDRRSFNKAIRTAKRIASGKRAGAACAACKKSRARCDDTRPCKRCRNLDICDGCDIPQCTKGLSIESAIQLRTVPTLDASKAVKLEDSPPAKEIHGVDDSPQVGLHFDIDIMLCNLRLLD